MKKLFLLSVLFIFMGNVSAEQSEIIYEIDNKLDKFKGDSAKIDFYFKTFCIAGYVFVNYENGTLTQVNKKVVLRNGNRYSVPMTCNEYKEKLN